MRREYIRERLLSRKRIRPQRFILVWRAQAPRDIREVTRVFLKFSGRKSLPISLSRDGGASRGKHHQKKSILPV